jgi:hypothetical protein
MQDVADENPNAQVLVRAVRFSDGAQWHVSQPTDIADFKWDDLEAVKKGSGRDELNKQKIAGSERHAATI